MKQISMITQIMQIIIDFAQPEALNVRLELNQYKADRTGHLP